MEQVKKENPDLVLLDVMMPDISGFEVAQQMKADPEMAEIPIIFLTALNSTVDIVKDFRWVVMTLFQSLSIKKN